MSGRQSEVIEVTGTARGPFSSLVDVFARSVAEQGRGGAALAIYRSGEPLVDLVAGDYRPDGLQPLFSVSKALSTVATAHAVEQGRLDLDEPIATYWPAFNRPSTSRVTPRMVLTHRSGLAALDRRLSYEELLGGVDAEAIEVQEPYWEPGTAHGYHAFTFGTLLAGVFQRVLGTNIGDYFATHIAQPHTLELWIGTPEREHPRVEKVLYPEGAAAIGARLRHTKATGIPPSSTALLVPETDLFNNPATYAAHWPSSSGVGSARSLAALGDLLLRDGAVIRSETLANFVATRSRGDDVVLGFPTHFGTGFQRPFPAFPMLSQASFGHEAAGGSAFIVDPPSGLSIGYTTSAHPRITGAAGGLLGVLATISHLLGEESQ